MKEELSHILNHVGEERENYYNAVCPPIIQSSNFAFTSFQSFLDSVRSMETSHVYSRGNNPTVEILCKKVAALEGTERALAYASGSGAVAAAMLPFLRTGDHVICVQKPYSWTKVLLDDVLPRFGIHVDYVDGTSIENISSAIKPETRVLFLESPNSATFELQDLEACGALCRKQGIISMIDNSYSTPIFQRPHELGIDVVIHAGTKYLNGHSDVMCGFVCGSEEHMKEIFHFSTMTLGNILSPSDAALVIRGLRTLEIRMKRSHATAQEVVQFLASHEKVESVLYPWSKDFPQYELAQKQMSGAGGLFSVLLKCKDVEKIEQFCFSLQAFLLAVSWGGHESLILPYGALLSEKVDGNDAIPVNLVRFYIGLEDADFLIADLEQALEVL